MRTLLALVALVVPTVAAVTAREADACGGYSPLPTVFEVEHHGWGKTGRQFVIFRTLGKREMDVGERTWRRVGPKDSFDNAAMAFGQRLEEAMEVTLLAPGRSTFVTTRTLGLLRDFDGMKSAVEIKAPKAAYVIALAGRREDASFVGLVEREGQSAWTIEGTGYSVGYEAVDGQALQLVVRRDGEVFAALSGEALGVLTTREGRFLAVQESWGVDVLEI